MQEAGKCDIRLYLGHVPPNNIFLAGYSNKMVLEIEFFENAALVHDHAQTAPNPTAFYVDNPKEKKHVL